MTYKTFEGKLEAGGFTIDAPASDAGTAEQSGEGGDRVTVVRLEEEDADRHWITFENFYVITRYNHSSMYAMSVYQLSQRLADRMAE